MSQQLAACINSANEANMRGDFEIAANWCRHALRLEQSTAEAWYNLGIALRGLGRRREAMNALEKARSLSLDVAEAQNSIGLELLMLGALRESEICLKRAIALAPDYPYPLSNMGKVRERQKRLPEAQEYFERALRLAPDLATLHANLGGILNARKQFEAAEAACRRAIELDPVSPVAWNNLGGALFGQKLFEAAETAFGKAVEIDAGSSEAWSNLGAALSKQKRTEAAEAACRKAIELDPNSSDAWRFLGDALFGSGRSQEAVDCYRKAHALQPHAAYIHGILLHARMHNCDWDGLAPQIAQLRRKIEGGEEPANPFDVLGLIGSPAVQRLAAKAWTDTECPERPDLGSISGRAGHDRIRIGYYSADFHNHATSYLIAGLLEEHDRERFEVFGFSFGPAKNDEMRRRVVAAFDRFIDVRNQSDKAVAQLSRHLGIDIAVDLKGCTEDCRTGIFAYRAAPVQVSYLGFPGTMAANYIDYLIADEVVIPKDDQRHYAESIVYLPHSYQANDSRRHIADEIPSREVLGLPDPGFVFCCFNNNFKITPPTFDIWMRILEQVDGSVFWLLEANSTVTGNLRKEAAKRGVSADRLIFAKRAPLPEHLARHRAADLFLDTLPYNAHTTASDALWAGLPVLTCTGDAFAGRVAASLLNAVGLPELITATPQQYEALAIRLATHRELLAEFKNRLEVQRLTAPLFDAKLFARHIENAYSQMYERSTTSIPPGPIYVAG